MLCDIVICSDTTSERCPTGAPPSVTQWQGHYLPGQGRQRRSDNGENWHFWTEKGEEMGAVGLAGGGPVFMFEAVLVLP